LRVCRSLGTQFQPILGQSEVKKQDAKKKGRKEREKQGGGIRAVGGS